MIGCSFKDRTEWLTNSDQVVDILDFDHVAEYPALLTLADRTAVLVFIENGAGRVDDLGAVLQLLQLRTSHKQKNVSDTKTTCQQETGADLGSFQRVDQTPVAHFLKPDHADRHALCCARLVSFQEPKERWCLARDRFDRWLDTADRNRSVGV